MTPLTDLEQEALRAIRSIAERIQSGGDIEAATILSRIAATAVDRLESAQEKHPEAFESYFSESLFWPAFVTPKDREGAQIVSRLIEKGFGSRASLNVEGEADYCAPMTAIAAQVFGCIQELQSGADPSQYDPGLVEWFSTTTLPAQLHRENANEWAKLTRPLMAVLWGQKYEEHAHFKTLISTHKKSMTPGQLRGLLADRWKQSWRSIAPHRNVE